MIAAIAIVWSILRIGCGRDDPDPAPLRIATFNIEDFPRHDRQVTGAFREIAALDARLVAVQEILDPATFARAARTHLGATWRFVHLDTAPDRAPGAHPSHHLGLAYDERAWTLVSVTGRDETRLGARHKPTLEVRLRPRAGGEILRVLVVHLKAGGEHAAIRARQLAALATILSTGAERAIVLGDFNATSDADREGIAALATRTGLAWATEPLGCSAFWDRDDGCFRSRLDHALTWRRPVAVHAAGACATHGCDREDTCPLYAEQVSDHCPVIVTLP